MDKKLLSIVVPCFNEELTINNFYNEAVAVFEKTNYNFEIIFVNDGSKDKTKETLQALAEKDERVKVVNFSRNFGQQAAILCGFKMSKGDAVIEADCDLQDPLTIVYDMIKKWEEGYQVVHGRRKQRAGESFFKKWSANAYYKLLAKITKVPIPRNTGDFKLYDRKAIDEVIAMPEKNKYLRGLASWVGFKQGFVDFDRKERVAGETKYTLKKMVKLAESGIISNSNTPLYISLGTGLAIGFLSVLCFITFIVLAICKVNLPLVAWLFPTITIMFSIGFVFNSISNIYLSKVYEEVKNRPDYIVDTTLNIEE